MQIDIKHLESLSKLKIEDNKKVRICKKCGAVIK